MVKSSPTLFEYKAKQDFKPILHYCACGKWGAFGKDVYLGVQGGVWTCGIDGCASAS